MGADLLEFAAPETAEFVSVRKLFKTTVEKVGRQILRKKWVVAASKVLQAKPFQQNLQSKPVGREETFLQTSFINHVEQFSVSTFFGSFWRCWSESAKI